MSSTEKKGEYICPGCGQPLELQEGFDPDGESWVCTECGQPVYLGTDMRKAFQFMRENPGPKQKQKEEQREERRQWLAKRLVPVLIVFMVIVGFIIAKQIHEKTPVGIDSETLIGMNYEEAKDSLFKQGFINFETVPMGDLSESQKDQEGEVESVAINGVDSFTEQDRFPFNARVTITYHSVGEEE